MRTRSEGVRHRAALGLLLLASTLVVMAGAVLAPVLALVRADLHLGSTGTGALLTVHALVIAVSSPAVGWAVDRYGVRVPLAAGLLLYGIAGGAGLVAGSYPALLASRMAFGVGAAAVFTGTTVALLELFPGPERDRVMGWRSTATSLGGVAWPLVGGGLGGLSWHAPFAVYLLGVPLGIAALRALPPSRPSAVQGRSGAGGRPGEGAPGGGLLSLLRRRPRLLGQCALLALGSVLLYALVVFLPLRLAELGVRSPLLVALLTVGMSLAMSLAGLGYAGASERLGPTRLLRGCYLAFAVAFALLAASDGLAILVIAQALFGLGMGLSIPALTVLLGESSPPQLRGGVMALSGTAIFLGQFLSPLLLGPLADATATPDAFAAASVLATGVLLLLLVERLDPAAPVLRTTVPDDAHGRRA